MIKLTLQDEQETAEFNVIAEPLITRPLIAETDVQTIDNNISTYITGTNRRQLEVSLGFVDAEAYNTLRGFRDRQYAYLKYPTATITTDTPIDLGYGEDVPDYRTKFLNLKGKNLFDKSNANIVAGTIGQNRITLGGSNRYFYISCEPNTTYTIQKRNDGNTNRFAVATTEELPTSEVATFDFVQNNNVASITITSNAAAAYLVVMYYRTQESAITEQQLLDSIQVEVGPEATTYSSYYNIELCKIGTYQDKIYKNGNNWVLHKETASVAMGSISGWAQSSTVGTYRYIKQSFSQNYGAVTGVGYCNVFTYGGATWTPNHFGIAASGNLWVGLSEAKADVTTFTTWLNTLGATLYYALATAVETTITNSDLIAQLEALQTGAFEGWTKIESEPEIGALQPTLTVSQGTITDTGKDVLLEGTTEDLLDFVILGDIEQNEFSGKNLCGLPDQSFTHNGVQITISNNEITMNGAANASGSKNLVPIYPTWLNGVYSTCLIYVSGSIAGTGLGNFNIRKQSDNSVVNGTQTELLASNNYRSYSVSGERIIFGIYVQNGNVFNNLKLKVQVVAGSSSDYNYEQYVGVSPSPYIPQAIQSVHGTTNFNYSGPSGRKRYAFRGKMALSEERIVDLCGTHEQVSLTIRESEQL